jgi:hypothetical protein
VIHRVASAAWERCNAPTTTVRNALWAMERAGSKTHCMYRYLYTVQYQKEVDRYDVIGYKSRDIQQIQFCNAIKDRKIKCRSCIAIFVGAKSSGAP